MEIKLNIDDCKKIASNVEKKYSEIEQCLARKMLAQEHVLAELKQKNEDLMGVLRGIYNRVNGCKFAGQLRELRKRDLESSSKASFAAAVRLDGQAKEM